MNINGKYLKDENGSIISPIVNSNTVFSPDGTQTFENYIKSIVSKSVNPYPYGSIYMSIYNTDPEILFGGVWEKLQDKFLLSSGSTYELGSTGGSSTKTIAKANLPSYNLTVTDPGHTHTYTDYYATSSSKKTWDINKTDYSVTSVGNTYTSRTSNSGATGITVASGGSGTAMDIMPPYEVVHVWKRTDFAFTITSSEAQLVEYICPNNTMTWAEWVNSSYNTAGLVLNEEDGYIYYDIAKGRVLLKGYSTIDRVSGTDTIEVNTAYPIEYVVYRGND